MVRVRGEGTHIPGGRTGERGDQRNGDKCIRCLREGGEEFFSFSFFLYPGDWAGMGRVR